MADPAAVYAAIQSLIDGDATLIALIPEGAFRNVTPPGVEQAVIISPVILQAEYVMGRSAAAYETVTVLVKAVEKATDVATVEAAAQRIQELLHDQPLTIDGYDHMRTERAEYISYTELDENTDERWQHCGGRYTIFVSPTN